MRMGRVLKEMEKGKKLQREDWNGKGIYIELMEPNDASDMTLPYIYIRTVQGDIVPWTCSQADLLADDWRVVE